MSTRRLADMIDQVTSLAWQVLFLAEPLLITTFVALCVVNPGRMPIWAWLTVGPYVVGRASAERRKREPPGPPPSVLGSCVDGPPPRPAHRGPTP